MNIILKINGQAYAGWKSANISLGLDRICRAFSVAVTWKFPTNLNAFAQIKPFDLVEVWADNDKILTGYVYAAPVSYSATGVSLSIEGRSKTSLLVDCSAIGKSQYRNTKAVNIITAMAKEYKIDVVDNSGVVGEITDYVHEKGESVLEAMQKILNKQRIVITDDGEGRLLFEKVGALKAYDNLELGKNLLGCDAQNDWTEVYSEYRVNGQSASGAPNDLDNEDDEDDEKSNTGGKEGGFTFERVKTTTLPVKRVLEIKQSGKSTSASAALRVEYEANVRNAKAQTRSYTVQNWRQSNGQLWQPNTLVKIKDVISGTDIEMLIIEVTYNLDLGSTTVLKVSPESGYGEFKEQKERKAKSSKTGTSGKNWDFVPKGT